MKKSLGISRNKYEALQAAKNSQVRKKNMYPLLDAASK